MLPTNIRRQLRRNLQISNHARVVNSIVSQIHTVSKVLRQSSELMSSCDAFLFDCDGVIWRGDSLIDGAPEVIRMLRDNNKHIFFVTNNSTKSREGYRAKFKKLGLDVNKEEIFSSSFAAAAYFQQNPLPVNKKVFIIGESGIGEELDEIGIKHIGGPSFAGKEIQAGARMEVDPDVAAVVVGFDSKINYYKINYAQLCIKGNPGCKFIATNMDAVGHFIPDQEWAGGGSMVGAVRACTGVDPILVGKPSSLMLDYIASKYRIELSRMCMVGDRLDTDVLFGINHGLRTVLVLSGVTSQDQLLSDQTNIRPEYYMTSIADLLK